MTAGPNRFKNNTIYMRTYESLIIKLEYCLPLVSLILCIPHIYLARRPVPTPTTISCIIL